MPRRVLLAVVAIVLVAGCGSSTPSAAPTPTPASAVVSSPTPSGSADAASIGAAFVAALAAGNDAGAQAMEDPTMVAAAPASKLGQLWAQLVTAYGSFESIGSVTAAEGAISVVSVPVSFASDIVTLTVAVSSDGRVGGLHVASVAPSSSATPPPPASYVRPGSFTESAVTVGSAPWTLPGTLSIPAGAGPFPAVVLVAGSGPEDRNETFGPNKPFEDLAWGLASEGIAVLRYDKRTLVYGARMATDTSITVRQETTDDAAAAVDLLRRTPKIDPSRVFVVGHSLGAYLAPRIVSDVPGELAGIAMLEAPSSPLPELLLQQTRCLASLGGPPSPQAEQQLATLQAQVTLAESPALSISTPASELPAGVPASYWLDLQAYHPVAVAAGLTIPMFFAQGERDYQVPPAQLQPWQRALAGHENATLRTYPAMDHLLLDGSGRASPAEYAVPGHVDPHLVADLAAWILHA